jgi:hypothetical protein
MLELQRQSSFFLIFVKNDLQKNDVLHISRDSGDLTNVVIAIKVFFPLASFYSVKINQIVFL